MCIQLQIYLSPPKGAKKSSSCAPARHTCVRGCWRWRRASVNTVASTPMTCSWRSVTPRPPSARTCWRTLGSPSCHSNRSETDVLMISLEARYKNIFFVLKWWSLNTVIFRPFFNKEQWKALTSTALADEWRFPHPCLSFYLTKFYKAAFASQSTLIYHWLLINSQTILDHSS